VIYIIGLRTVLRDRRRSTCGPGGPTSGGRSGRFCSALPRRSRRAHRQDRAASLHRARVLRLPPVWGGDRPPPRPRHAPHPITDVATRGSSLSAAPSGGGASVSAGAISLTATSEPC
jgi:hypothetical protein